MPEQELNPVSQIVETYGVDRDGAVIHAQYHDREKKAFHKDVRLALKDFGERISMLSTDGLLETNYIVDGNVTDVLFTYENGTTIHVFLY